MGFAKGETMIPEKELLDLLNKTEPQLIDYFKNKGILKYRSTMTCGCSAKYIQWESLADCADRLWERVVKKGIVRLAGVMDKIYSKIKMRDISSTEFWMYRYKSIDRIIASIIAIQRAGEKI